jgi:hypothetical protein
MKYAIIGSGEIGTALARALPVRKWRCAGGPPPAGDVCSPMNSERLPVAAHVRQPREGLPLSRRD